MVRLHDFRLDTLSFIPAIDFVYGSGFIVFCHNWCWLRFDMRLCDFFFRFRLFIRSAKDASRHVAKCCWKESFFLGWFLWFCLGLLLFGRILIGRVCGRLETQSLHLRFAILLWHLWLGLRLWSFIITWNLQGLIRLNWFTSRSFCCFACRGYSFLACCESRYAGLRGRFCSIRHCLRLSK